MIYVVTAGEYSDYHIIGATTSAKTADAIYEKFSKAERNCKIERFPNGACILRPLWGVKMKHDGGVEWCWDASLNSYAYEDVNQVCEVTTGTIVYVYAETREGAIKAAAERRAKFLAERNGL